MATQSEAARHSEEVPPQPCRFLRFLRSPPSSPASSPPLLSSARPETLAGRRLAREASREERKLKHKLLTSHITSLTRCKSIKKCSHCFFAKQGRELYVLSYTFAIFIQLCHYIHIVSMPLCWRINEEYTENRGAITLGIYWVQ